MKKRIIFPLLVASLCIVDAAAMDRLPSDCLNEIFSFLPQKAFVMMRCVNGEWRGVVDEYKVRVYRRELWNNLFFRKKDDAFKLSLESLEKGFNLGLNKTKHRDHLISLDCTRTNISNQQLKIITEIFKYKLAIISLIYCKKITDDGLEHLGELKNLRKLKLGNCNQITDSGLKHIKRLTSLRKLNLNGCNQITDAGLGHLKGLKKLWILDLGWCVRIMDHGLQHLKKLNSLRTLNLCLCVQITNDGLKHLKGLTNLRKLRLNRCDKITNAGLGHLKWLKDLRKLSFSLCNQITDDGLKHLKKLKNLQYLDLWSCDKITSAAIEELKKEIPRLKVYKENR